MKLPTKAISNVAFININSHALDVLHSPSFSFSIASFVDLVNFSKQYPKARDLLSGNSLPFMCKAILSKLSFKFFRNISGNIG